MRGVPDAQLVCDYLNQFVPQAPFTKDDVFERDPNRAMLKVTPAQYRPLIKALCERFGNPFAHAPNACLLAREWNIGANRTIVLSKFLKQDHAEYQIKLIDGGE